MVMNDVGTWRKTMGNMQKISENVDDDVNVTVKCMYRRSRCC